MKFSNTILTVTLSILLLDTGFVLGKKPRKGRGKGPGKRGKLIGNQCEALNQTEDEEVDKRECMRTLNCDVENEVCIAYVPIACGEITDPTKKDCRKNGCLFVEGACEVDPCIATCLGEDNNTCCLKRCQSFDKCSKANSKQRKCEKKKKKKNKGECVYDSETNVCSRVVEGCYAFNGQATDCDAAVEGCVYDACTEQCSKE